VRILVGTVSIPYDVAVIEVEQCIFDDDTWQLIATVAGERYLISDYDSEEEAVEEFAAITVEYERGTKTYHVYKGGK